MNTILKAAAAVLAAAFISTAAQADDSLYGSDTGAVIVPASTNSTDVDASAIFPTVQRGKIVTFQTSKKRGSIVISTQKNELYLVLGYNKAVMYRVATARKGFEWAGVHKVTAKTEWPDWRPPVEMRARHPELPAYMAGGPKNPLGARAMYLGSSIYRIHGTNEPKSIGKAASSGCIRMLNADVTELYTLVKIGAEVTVN